VGVSLIIAGCSSAAATPTAASATAASATTAATSAASAAPVASPTAKAPYYLTIGTDMSSQFTSACCSIPMANGFQAWIANVNSQGGVNDHQVVVNVLDDRADVATGLANYQQTLDSKSLGFMIEGSSTVFTPIAAKVGADKIVESNVGGYKGGIGVYPYVYNILANLPMFAVELPKFAATKVTSATGSKVAYFTYDSTLTETFQPAITKAFTDQGWKLVYSQLVPTTASDFAVAAGSIAAGSPDVVVVDLLEGQLPQFVSQLRARGVKAPIVNFSSNIADATKAKIADTNLFFLESTASPTNQSNPAVVAMDKVANATKFTTGVYNAFFIQGYVHAQIVLAALAKCGDTCTRDSLNSALENTTVPGGGLMAGNPGYSPDSHVQTKSLIVDYWDLPSASVKLAAGYSL
jgi:ABC-type branched-subunit amino acid transport system substrate-binding protein